MMQKSLNLSGKINDQILEVLEAISNIAVSLNIRFFVVGATARDIILHYGFNVAIKRATDDVDIGVMVENWKEFGLLKESMLNSGSFLKDIKEAQRFHYKGGFPVDIVPFGQISEPNEIISWPESDGVEMKTLGFIESYDNSVLVQLRADPVFEIKFASLAGLAAMKIISWKDNYPMRSKDAQDFEYIMLNYIEAGNVDRVYSGEDADISEGDASDFNLMSARLLGRDVATILTSDSKDYIFKILGEETGEQKRYKFIEDMRRGGILGRDNFEERLKLIEAFSKGFLERF
jgi:predicted nucleotidyltransferase